MISEFRKNNVFYIYFCCCLSQFHFPPFAFFALVKELLSTKGTSDFLLRYFVRDYSSYFYIYFQGMLYFFHILYYSFIQPYN